MEEEYKRLLEEIRDAYFLLQDEKFAIVNSKLRVDYGYSKDDLIGKPFIELIAPEEQERVLSLHRNRLAGQIAPEARYESAIVTKDGTRVPVELSVWLTSYRGRPAIAGIAVDITERRRQRAEHVRAEENERLRLARALHDDTIQELLLITHRLQDIVAGTYGKLPEAAREHLREVRGLVERTINEVRRFTQDLRPEILDDMGLVPALRWLADRFIAGDGVDAEVRAIGQERRLSPDVELALFRIAQEALSNVRRHASASTAIIVLEFSEEKVMMSINDDGKGFEPPATPNHFAKQGKHGIRGMIERIHLIGGSHNIESTLGKGSSIRVEIAT
jgi:PAS domain S-box-containing protein